MSRIGEVVGVLATTLPNGVPARYGFFRVALLIAAVPVFMVMATILLFQWTRFRHAWHALMESTRRDSKAGKQDWV